MRAAGLVLRPPIGFPGSTVCETYRADARGGGVASHEGGDGKHDIVASATVLHDLTESSVVG